jgi:hypothetical protein
VRVPLRFVGDPLDRVADVPQRLMRQRPNPFPRLTPAPVERNPEVIALAGKPEQVAYVLSSDGEWTTLLEEGSRRVVIVRTGDIASRTVCNLTDRPRRSLMQVIEG